MEFSENIKVYFTYDTRNAVKCNANHISYIYTFTIGTIGTTNVIQHCIYIHIYPCCPAAWHQNTVLACYNHVCYSGILIITILNQYLNHQQAIYTYTMDIFIHFPHPSSISLDNIPSCKEMPLCRLLLSGPSDISVIWRCSTTGVQKDTPAGRFWPREVLVWWLHNRQVGWTTSSQSQWEVYTNISLRRGWMMSLIRSSLTHPTRASGMADCSLFQLLYQPSCILPEEQNTLVKNVLNF